MPRIIQNAFNSGEWSGLLEGRTDLDKYARSVYQLENMILDPRGPAHFRPGFRYIATAKGQSYLASFDFGAEQSYILEFGDQYIRFYKDQVQITSGGNPYEISTPYALADIPLLVDKSFQSFDVMYLIHPDYTPYKLSRTAHTSWTLTAINFNPPAVSEQGHELAAGITLSALTGTGVTVTADASVFLNGDIRRLITSGAGRASITSYTSATEVTCDIIDNFAALAIASGSWLLNGSPNGSLLPSIKSPVGAICNFTSAGETSAFTNLVEAYDVFPGTNWEASGSGVNEYYLANTATFFQATQPSFVYENGTVMVEGIIGELGIQQWAWGDNDALGYSTIYIRLSDETDPDTKKPSSYIKCSTTVANGDVFRAADVGKYIRIYGGMAKITSFVSATEVNGELLKEMTSVEDDTVITATENWTLESTVWNADNGYPSCGCFFGERLCLAGSAEFPDTVWGSVVGDYENFTPGVDDSDSFSFTLGARKANVIRWLEPDDFLLIGTMEKVWKLGSTGVNEPLTPLNVEAARQTPTRGCANIAPQQADKSVLYVQRHGRKIRELTWSWEEEKYVAPDLTLLAEHITEGVIANISYQGEPNSILWCLMEDGTLKGLTYLRDEDVIGWHSHPLTNGTVESIAVIPGDGYDELWAVIQRTINGSTVRYVEMMEQLFNESNTVYAANKGLNAFFVDSGYTYNGASTTTITGLSHLEGQTVTVLADGAYVSSKTVASGQITLSTAATIVHVGLPYTGKLVPMRLDANLRDGTAQARFKKIQDVYARVHRSGPFKIGPDTDDLDVCQDKERLQVMGAPYPLYTGDLTIGYDGRWETDGRITIVQDKPMPFTLLAIIYDVDMT